MTEALHYNANKWTQTCCCVPFFAVRWVQAGVFAVLGPACIRWGKIWHTTIVYIQLKRLQTDKCYLK